MKEEDKMATRREALKTIFQGVGFMGMGGILWGGLIKESKAVSIVLRPPGALAEKDFLKACVKCGECVEACPYDTLKLANPEDDKPLGTPYFEPREIPCEMCVGIPCVPVCPSGALDINSLSGASEENEQSVLDVNKSRMGTAIIDNESCVAYWGIQCDACYRACPLIDKAIKLEYSKNENTGKHAYLIPKVVNEVCTGCGRCEHACITEKASIKVLPKELVAGFAGKHYLKNGENPGDDSQNKNQDDENSEKALEYLNGDWEDLIND